MNHDTERDAVGYVQIDRMLLSMRSSGYDTPAAVGEPIDNAVQAEAHNINLRLMESTILSKKNRSIKVVERIAIGDDGQGMPDSVLHRCLVLGYSTRYDSRTGLGRFGVGATLAALSQAKRVDVYSRTSGTEPWLHVHLDLDQIAEGKTSIDPPSPEAIPEEFQDLVGQGSGTLVVWSKCDRIAEGEQGTVRDVKTITDQLRLWLGRTYRYFLHKGCRMSINGQPVEPHDPLYLMDIPGREDDLKAEVLVDEQLHWPLPSDEDRVSLIRVRLTLLPQEWRQERGEGGSEFAKNRRIDENEGLSIVRAGREVFWGNLPYFYPPDKVARDSQVRIDRWFGLEISFSPELDELFGVRNVKRGVEPFDSLRKMLRDTVKPWILTARERIRKTYQARENRKKQQNQLHVNAERAGAEFNRTAPTSVAGAEIGEDARSLVINDVVAHILNAIESPDDQTVQQVKEEVARLPFKIVDEQWPGREFVEIDHLGKNTIIRLNNGHPFFTRIYSKIVSASGRLGDGSTISREELITLAGVVQDAIDIMLIAYAKAESMAPDPVERYGDLRSNWGQNLYKLIQNHFADE